MSADLLTNEKTVSHVSAERMRFYTEQTQVYFRVVACFSCSKHPQTAWYGIYRNQTFK